MPRGADGPGATRSGVGGLTVVAGMLSGEV